MKGGLWCGLALQVNPLVEPKRKNQINSKGESEIEKNLSSKECHCGLFYIRAFDWHLGGLFIIRGSPFSPTFGVRGLTMVCY